MECQPCSPPQEAVTFIEQDSSEIRDALKGRAMQRKKAQIEKSQQSDGVAYGPMAINPSSIEKCQ